MEASAENVLVIPSTFGRILHKAITLIEISGDIIPHYILNFTTSLTGKYPLAKEWVMVSAPASVIAAPCLPLPFP